MRQHTKKLLIIGIVFLQSSPCFSQEGDLPGPKVIVDFIARILPQASTQVAASLLTTGLFYTLRQAQSSGESIWEYISSSQPKLDCVTSDDLTTHFNATGQNIRLPEKINSILELEAHSHTGEHNMMLLYGKPGTGKTTLAQQIACSTQSNYYHVHQKEFDNYSDATVARFLHSYIQMISDQTPQGQTAILHLEEFGKQFGAPSDNNIIETAQHGKYQNTWKLFTESLKKYPRVRVIACSNNESYNNAIADRIHPIHIGNPTFEQRQDYFKFTHRPYLEEQNKKAVINITEKATTQGARNAALQNDWHVTDAMIAKAAIKHQEKLTKLDNSISAQSFLNPLQWPTTWNTYQEKREIQKEGYFTNIVESKFTEADIKTLAQQTDGRSFRELDKIRANAQDREMGRIARMKHHGENETSAYNVNPKTRTYTLTTHDYDETAKSYTDKPKEFSGNYGAIDKNSISTDPLATETTLNAAKWQKLCRKLETKNNAQLIRKAAYNGILEEVN